MKMLIFKKALQHFEDKLPFIIYNKPNQNKLIGIFQQNDHLYFVNNYKELGFVFAPFEGSELVLIPENESQVLVEELFIDFKKIKDKIINAKESNHDKINFESLVKKGIDAINNGKLKKVVLSRKEIINLNTFNIISVFQQLVLVYPSAYKYCFYHPKIGLWFGAFSEKLLQLEGKKFNTMAVAGTKRDLENEDFIWGNKEKMEQAFVTDFIVENLKNQVSNIKLSAPYTMKAGNVVHLKTDIKGELNMGSNLKELIEILHPTPAVCGLPKELAKDFILENEGYSREYYSGFFGEINKDFNTNSKTTDLYVNLRCMQIVKKSNLENPTAILYIGCGITKDSIPEKEWQETFYKSQTIKQVLDYSISNQ